jgi:amidase
LGQEGSARRALSQPTADDIAALAAADEIVLDAGEADELLPVVASLVRSADLAMHLPEATQAAVITHRNPGYVPSAAENPFNSFIRKCHVRERDSGPLAGKTIGLKDNISLAGVPTTNGSRMTPWMPSTDAVVVERILHAGGTIVGKLNMDDFGASGLGETSAFGPPRNPIDPARSAGGSSGGSGAAVRAGEVDMALGVDQGGSGRIPAAFCGIVTMKASLGLVSTFGVTHVDHTIDFVTPMAKSVGGVAQLLKVIAGEDSRDPQWVRGKIDVADYERAASDGVSGLRVGIVVESSLPEICEKEVLDGLTRSAQALSDNGAVVSEVSIPLWRHALSIFLPYMAHLQSNMLRTEGIGYGHLGTIEIDTMLALARSRRHESGRLAKQVKSWLMAERYMHEKYLNEPYARLHNLRLSLTRQITQALDQFDLLLTPTLPITAPLLSSPGTSFAEISAGTADRLCYNTTPLNLSGHPGLSLPSGSNAHGLPTAVQVVGRKFDEYTVFRAGFQIEQTLDLN